MRYIQAQYAPVFCSQYAQRISKRSQHGWLECTLFNRNTKYMYIHGSSHGGVFITMLLIPNCHVNFTRRFLIWFRDWWSFAPTNGNTKMPWTPSCFMEFCWSSQRSQAGIRKMDLNSVLESRWPIFELYGCQGHSRDAKDQDFQWFKMARAFHISFKVEFNALLEWDMVSFSVLWCINDYLLRGRCSHLPSIFVQCFQCFHVTCG